MPQITLALHATDTPIQRAEKIVSTFPIGMPDDLRSQLTLQTAKVLEAYAKADAGPCCNTPIS